MFKGLLAGLLVFAASASAHASLMLEPYAKYSMGTLEMKSTGGSTATWKANGIGAGARLGFTGRHLFLVADYGAIFSGNLKGDGGGATDLDNFKETQLGAVVGLRFGSLRLFGGYDFTNELSADSAGVTSMFHGGHAIKAGLGFLLNPVAINVEYVDSTYDQVKSNGVDQSVRDAGYSEIKGHAIVASLSFPLGLGL